MFALTYFPFKVGLWLKDHSVAELIRLSEIQPFAIAQQTVARTMVVSAAATTQE